MLASAILAACHGQDKYITFAYYGPNIGDGISDSYVITERTAGGRDYKRTVIPREKVLEAWQAGGDLGLDQLLEQVL